MVYYVPGAVVEGCMALLFRDTCLPIHQIDRTGLLRTGPKADNDRRMTNKRAKQISPKSGHWLTVLVTVYGNRFVAVSNRIRDPIAVITTMSVVHGGPSWLAPWTERQSSGGPPCGRC